KARLEHRFKLELHVDDAVKQALVPQLLLQPVVENALRHGMNPHTFNIDVRLLASLEGDRVHLTVRDSGPGFPLRRDQNGTGLLNTRQRLIGLYGKEGSLIVSNAPGGGAIVEISLPFRAKQVL